MWSTSFQVPIHISGSAGGWPVLGAFSLELAERPALQSLQPVLTSGVLELTVICGYSRRLLMLILC